MQTGAKVMNFNYSPEAESSVIEGGEIGADRKMAG